MHAWMVVLAAVVACGGRTSEPTPGVDEEGIVCGADVCPPNVPCVACPGRTPFCVPERPAAAPDFWVPAHECPDPEAVGILTLYCDDESDCAPLRCLWHAAETLCAETPALETCAAAGDWRPVCEDASDCAACARGCADASDGLAARRCE